MLVRGHRLDLHRRLGMAMAWLVPVMVVVGLATAWTVQRQVALLPVPHRPQFISVNLTDMLGFATLAGAGLWLRRDPSAHKRLMLLSLSFISAQRGSRGCGCLRWGRRGHDSFWGFFLAYNLGGDIAVALLGIYDLATRGRLHPAYVLGAGWILVNELAAAWAVFQPGLEGDFCQAIGTGMNGCYFADLAGRPIRRIAALPAAPELLNNNSYRFFESPAPLHAGTP